MKALAVKTTERYYWKGIVDSCEEWVANCHLCQQAKTSTFTKPASELHPVKMKPRFWRQVFAVYHKNFTP